MNFHIFTIIPKNEQQNNAADYQDSEKIELLKGEGLLNTRCSDLLNSRSLEVLLETACIGAHTTFEWMELPVGF